jgi:transcriptional regulator with XRE-family HTH domain
MENLADKLKYYRVGKGWSQELLARRLGVSLNTVQRWESGKTKPSPLALDKLQDLIHDLLEKNQLELL